MRLYIIFWRQTRNCFRFTIKTAYQIYTISFHIFLSNLPFKKAQLPFNSSPCPFDLHVFMYYLDKVTQEKWTVAFQPFTLCTVIIRNTQPCISWTHQRNCFDLSNEYKYKTHRCISTHPPPTNPKENIHRTLYFLNATQKLLQVYTMCLGILMSNLLTKRTVALQFFTLSMDTPTQKRHTRVPLNETQKPLQTYTICLGFF